MNMSATHSIATRRGGNGHILGAAIDERVAQIDANGAVTFIHNDKQNSVIAISDAVGNPVQRRGYGTYGETDPAQMVGTTTAGTSAHPFGYTGRRWDPDLNYYRACRTHKAPPQRQPLARYKQASNQRAALPLDRHLCRACVQRA
jgi:hypothetical protein